MEGSLVGRSVFLDRFACDVFAVEDPLDESAVSAMSPEAAGRYQWEQRSPFFSDRPDVLQARGKRPWRCPVL